MRPISRVAPDWWDYTTLDREILDDAARLAADDLLPLVIDAARFMQDDGTILITCTNNSNIRITPFQLPRSI